MPSLQQKSSFILLHIIQMQLHVKFLFVEIHCIIQYLEVPLLISVSDTQKHFKQV